MEYDASIIGSGPAGYVCAIKVAQLGGKAVVFERAEVGGICTNSGCIPTKAIQASAGLFDKIKESKRMGLVVNEFSLDMLAVKGRKDRIVKISAMGIRKLLDSYGIELVEGDAKVKDTNTVTVGDREFTTKNIVIASGAVAAMLPGLEINDRILTHKEMLDLETLPKDLAVIGGGYIGSEFASILNKMGVKVTLYEMTDRLVPTEDEDICRELEKLMKRSGIDVQLNTKVDVNKLTQEKVLIACGVKPIYDQEAVDLLGLEADHCIKVNARMQSNVKNVYAIGDVTGMMMLAHVAYAQAEVAATNIMGRSVEMDASVVPSCIFTLPEIASVGKREQDFEDKTGLKIATVPFMVNGKARCIGETAGFVKVIAKDDILVGCHIIGAQADSLIHEAALAIKTKTNIKQIRDTIHAHPTLSEAFHEAVYALDGKSVHMLKSD